MMGTKKSFGILIFLGMLFILGQVGWRPTSTLKDQQSVAITIYNSNIGLVKGNPAGQSPAGGPNAEIYGCGREDRPHHRQP